MTVWLVAGFKPHPGLRSEQEIQKSLREQPPEKSTGSFDPVLVYHLLRSGSQYSLRTVGQSLVQPARAGVPFAGRSRSRTTPMHDTRRSAAAQTQENTERDDRGCPGCPGGVLSGPPFSRDTLFDRLGRCAGRIHSKESKVSGVSGVILKTIASVGTHTRPPTRRRGKRGFSKQPGHPGHVRKLTTLSGNRRLLPTAEGVRCDFVLERTHPDTPDTCQGWSE